MNNGGFGYNPAGYVKNFDCLRRSCYWAGGFGLVQSLIWIGLTLTGILSYSCIITIEGTFNYGSLFRIVFMDLYFMGTCGLNTIPSYNSTMLRQVHTVLNPQDIVIWDSVYLAVAVCWLLSSVLILTYLKPNQPRVVSGVLWTWILITFIICSMDLALGIIFGIDYGRFMHKAYHFNLDSMYAGEINPDAAQLLAGMVASISMMILSFKGFVLWLINVSFMLYLTVRAIFIGYDNSGRTSNLFMVRKESDDILATRPPINAYQEEDQKPSVMSTVFANEGFEPDNRTPENAVVINRDIIARAARLSTDVSLQERRFRNLDNFQQYPPRSRPESMMPEQNQQQQNSPIVVAAFPAPDYTPPMQRAAHNPNRNQRYQ